MAHKFIKAAYNDTCVMIKVDIDGKEVWADTTKTVKDYAKKSFEEGVECKLTYTEQEGKYNVSRIEVVGGTKPTSAQPTEYKCEDCGCVLKDSKYKKCYNCNKKSNDSPVTAPVTASAPSSSVDKGMTVNESIKRQAIMHAVSRSLISLQGHIDPNNIGDIAEQLYKKFQQLVG